MPFLEDYTMLDELGQGGYATVYKVRHNQLGYIRAVRVLNAVIADENDPKYRNFLSECRILLRLGNGVHPNIIHIHQPLLRSQRAIVEMDYIDGEDLYHHLKRNNSFVPAEDVMRLLTDIGSALAYCHEDIYKFCMDKDEDNLRDDPADGSKLLIDEATRKRLIDKYRVIHNDIHSGNIIRRENGSYVLLNFGLAIEGAEVVRSSRRKNGAPEFKSPEKWDNEGVLTTQSDIYSFGVVLYEFLAGRVPFPFDKQNTDSTEAEYLLGRAHRYQQPEPIFGLRKAAFEAAHPGEEYRQDYPQWIEDVIMKCLAKDPAKRYRNGRELYDCIAKHSGSDEARETKIHEYEEQIAELQRKVELKILELERARAELSQATAEGEKWKIASNASNGRDFVETALDLNMKMVWVEGGEFLMGGTSEQGSEAESDEQVIRRVKLDSYYIGECEITQEQWEKVMGTSIQQQRSKSYDNGLRGVGPDYPMYYVSWEEARAFCQELSYLTGRKYCLPTEAEWEYAARGGKNNDGTKYSGSDNLDEVAWYGSNSGNNTHPVKTKRANSLGLYDMSGNVYEWCLDWYGSYNANDKNNPTGPASGSRHVLRGGGWGSDARYCRVSNRGRYSPGGRDSDSGFRVVVLP